MARFLFSVIMLMTISTWVCHAEISTNTSDTNGETCAAKGDPLINLGDISTKIVQTIAESSDETVDIIAIASLVNALSKGAAIVKNPEMYKDINGADTDNKVAKLDQTIRGMSEQIKQMQTKFTLVQQHVLAMEVLEEELNQTKEVVNKLEAQLKQSQGVTSSDSEFIGFLATTTTSQSLSDNEKLLFPQVMYNYGSAFDPATGIFTCTETGMYLISVHLEEYGANGLMVDGIVDNKAVFRIHVHDDSNEHGSTSATVPVGCLQGKKIWLQSEDSGRLHGTEKRCVFSVHFMRRMAENDVVMNTEI